MSEFDDRLTYRANICAGTLCDMEPEGQLATAVLHLVVSYIRMLTQSSTNALIH